METARIIVLHGPGAAGKYTIARELSRITGLGLFHNHLTVDLLLPLFPFGSPDFVRHRERIWLEVMADAVSAGTSFIFTFNPERTVNPSFPGKLREQVASRGGRVTFVSVECPEEEIERRIESESRRAFRKLASLKAYRRLRAECAFEYPAIASDFDLDSSRMSAPDSALAIAAALNLPRAPEAPPP